MGMQLGSYIRENTDRRCFEVKALKMFGEAEDNTIRGFITCTVHEVLARSYRKILDGRDM
jgi:hypothetical protein